MSGWRRVVVGLVAFSIVALGAVWVLLLAPFPVMPEAEAALASGGGVVVESGTDLTFTPDESVATTGLILYGGARVPPAAYAPSARAIASAGYLVVIPQLPLNFAVFDPDAALDVVAAHPELTTWVIAGHSLGGAMATRLAGGRGFDWLVLWAAYPEASLDLSASTVSVASIFGSEDTVATPAEVQAARPRLPAGTSWVEVVGGNHAGFGWYGPQRGDGVAGISRQEQTRQVVEATIALLAGADQ